MVTKRDFEVLKGNAQFTLNNLYSAIIRKMSDNFMSAVIWIFVFTYFVIYIYIYILIQSFAMNSSINYSNVHYSMQMTVCTALACTMGRAPILWLTSTVNAPMGSLVNGARRGPLPAVCVAPAHAAVASVWTITQRVPYAASVSQDSRQVRVANRCMQ